MHTDESEGAVNIMELAKEMINAIHYINKNTAEMELHIRIGVHTGPAVAGVIGKNKFAYDLWGATINMANRLETTCPSGGGIHISESTKAILKNKYKYQLCTNTKIKGIGKVNTYLIV